MRHNKSVSVSGRMGFMTPILLFVLLFVICCGVAAGIFLRAFVITEDAETCHAGVYLCRNQAECFRAGEIPEQNTMVYYDENIQPSDPETAAYYVTVTDQPEETAAGTLHTGIITAHTIDGTEIYTLNVAAYLPGEG